MTGRLVWAAIAAVGLAVAPVAIQTGNAQTGNAQTGNAQTGKAPLVPDAPGVQDGSRPATGAPGGVPGGAPGGAAVSAPGGGVQTQPYSQSQSQPQRLDAIFEALPPSLTRNVVFNAENLHFVPIRTQKGTIVLVWGGAEIFWARSRGLKFLKYVHRLDAETTGILLFAKSQGAVEAFGDLFESRQMEKTYLAVVTGTPKESEWTCRFKLAPDERRIGRMKVDGLAGKEAETHFKVLQQRETTALVEAQPLTGRTHQIRVHLAESGCPVFADELYGRRQPRTEMGLHAVRLAYTDPFTRRRVEIRAPVEKFCREYGFDPLANFGGAGSAPRR